MGQKTSPPGGLGIPGLENMALSRSPGKGLFLASILALSSMLVFFPSWQPDVIALMLPEQSHCHSPSSLMLSSSTFQGLGLAGL